MPPFLYNTFIVETQIIPLADLFKTYYICRKNKRNTINAVAFEPNLEEELIQLKEAATNLANTNQIENPQDFPSRPELSNYFYTVLGTAFFMVLIASVTFLFEVAMFILINNAPSRPNQCPALSPIPEFSVK